MGLILCTLVCFILVFITLVNVVTIDSKLLTVGCGLVFQRLLRLQDAKQVEAKAAKIKEWVTNKLREVG
jgi:hypothetical protein